MNKQQQTQNFQDDDAISALADGALQGDAFAEAMQRLATDDGARAQWHAYHVVGDVLRSDDLAACSGDLAFLARLEARLALEPVPVSIARPQAVPLAAPAVVPVLRPAANGDVFRWKVAAGFASMAAVAAIGWQALQLQPAASGALLAQAPLDNPANGFQAVRAEMSPVPEVAADGQPVMLRNAQLDELLAAHNRAVGGSALQSQVRLLRNVSVTEDFTR